jgi:hypothetical protein
MIVLFSQESRTVIRSELTDVVVQAKSRPMWARNTAGQDVIQISWPRLRIGLVRGRADARVGRHAS